mmetsp:Transcript_22877/g.34341  ORF Transcript_22877/g.34341 Transcript_22877/m.34341 type:complete len:159 (-) Transcript_22877:281-757(-)|eukprot:CAMPEP_0116019566 /NCGR_PEP_ID=MMETSP0321-20121206/9308_1 /TAXON_ID=163516 /ORGANISM="Leptocylindrus danicus var. danicus, Strain B650" /LENGTH=158 /DNA_ID=CAMNT_0003490151 /DNA_START=78 /DNA_END=554 /DNA_ORIENTATION=+
MISNLTRRICSSSAAANRFKKHTTSSVSVRSLCSSSAAAPVETTTDAPTTKAETVPITYIEPHGAVHEVQAEIGKNLLTVAHENNVDLEGACGGELACSTCHLVFEKEVYDRLPEKDEEEDDMLDLAWALTDTSRLGCQICVTKELAGITVQIPEDDV